MTSSTVAIVCGMPRSSTTMVQSLLNAHRHILIYDEFPLFMFGDLRPLVVTYETFLGTSLEAWRGLAPAELRRRKAELVTSLWRLVSDPEKYRADSTGARVVGMKTPRAEVDHAFYDSVFEAGELRYLYCLRHPLRVFASLCAMPWMRAVPDPAGHVRELYADSYKHLCALEETPGRVLVVQVDRVGPTAEERHAFCRQVLGFLGEAPTPEVLDFAGRWPVVDHWASGREAGPVRELLAGFARDEVVQEIAHRFGYRLDA